jgi:ribosomal protein S18 acetylase RimI-like enzyme
MVVRIVLLEELEPWEGALVDLYLRCYKGMEEYAYKRPRDVRHYLRWLFKRVPSSFFIALEGDKPLGFLVADDHWEEGDLAGGEIHEVVVIPEDRTRGVGKALVQRALDCFCGKGLKRAGLWVGEKNERAKAFYAHLGFREKGSQGKWVRMECALE